LKFTKKRKKTGFNNIKIKWKIHQLIRYVGRYSFGTINIKNKDFIDVMMTHEKDIEKYSRYM